MTKKIITAMFVLTAMFVWWNRADAAICPNGIGQEGQECWGACPGNSSVGKTGSWVCGTGCVVPAASCPLPATSGTGGNTDTGSGSTTGPSTCIAGTVGISGPGTCKILLNGTQTIISYCTGSETSGPCRSSRVNESAANDLARKAESMAAAAGISLSCTVEKVSIGGGIDVSTNLDYYYNVQCSSGCMTGLSADTVSTSQGIATLKTELANNQCSSNNLGGNNTNPAGTIPTSNTNASGVSSTLSQKYFPNGFNSTSPRDQNVAAQLRLIETGKNIISRYFQEFAETKGGCSSGTNSFGVVSDNCIGEPKTSTNNADSSSASKKFRYLKVDITRAGWVAAREIEVYNKAGSKITIPASKATASCTWCNYGVPPPNVGVASLVDGNIETLWNAGETAQGCNWASGGCLLNTTRSAWFIIDLGVPTEVSRIRLAMTGNPQETDTFSVSDDGKTFSKLVDFTATPSAPFKDRQWLEWPTAAASGKTYAGPPTATLTINGSASANILPLGEGAVIEWNSNNADSASFTVTGMNPQCIPGGNPDPYLWKSFPYAPDNFAGIHGLGNQFKGQYFFDDYLNGCEAGRTITITYTAKQLSGGKTATAVATLKMGTKQAAFPSVKLRPNSTTDYWGYEINGSYNSIEFTPSGGTSNKTIQVNVNGGKYLSNMSIPGSTDITAAYPFPVLTTENSTSAISSSLGAPTPISNSLMSELVLSEKVGLNITSGGSLPKGIHKVRIYGNKGEIDQAFYDIPVFVADPNQSYFVTSDSAPESSASALSGAALEQKKQEILNEINQLSAQVATMAERLRLQQQSQTQ